MLPYDELKKTAEKWESKTAFVTDDGAEVSFGRLLERVDRLAGALSAAGVGKGDVVAVMLPNCVEFAELFLASSALGAVFQPMDVRFSGEDLMFAMKHTSAKFLASHVSLAEAAEATPPGLRAMLLVGGEREGWSPYEGFLGSGSPLEGSAAVDEETDDAVYLYTSGTTGSMKCVPMTWRQLDFFPRDMLERLDISPDDRGITLIPMSHISGPIVISLVVSVGCSFVVMQRWRPDILVDLMERHRVTWTHSVPSLAELILKGNPAGRDLSSFRFVALMGTRVPTQMLEEFEKAVPSCRAIQGYGLTETSPLLTLMSLDEHAAKRGSIGRALGDLDIRVVNGDGTEAKTGNPGELVVRGPRIFRGYVGAPELTAAVFEGDWFHTGDVVRVDGDGCFYHIGRLDDVINTGGLMVYPAEVENALLSDPRVVDAVVYGVPDEKRGFAVAADVQAAEGSGLVAAADVRRFLRGRLADYKVPRVVELVDEIERTATGKPVRRRS